MNTFNLTLDLNKSRASSPVRLRQGDAQGTTITALILDHGATANLTGMTAQLVMELPDGTQYYRKDASVSGNVVTVVVDESTAASVPGRTANAYFQLLQGTTVKASTGSFAVEILPDALEGHTVPESYDSAIQDAIDALDAAVEQMPDMVEDVLTAHPEWTTTVQDGSITKAKLATDLALDRERLLYRLDNMLTAQLPEGDVATASDAAQTPLAGLALYGRSTQGGTPTPSAPVAIESVRGNLVDIAARHVTSQVTLGSFTLPAGTYTVVADVTNGGTLTAYVSVYDGNNVLIARTTTNIGASGVSSATFTLASESLVAVRANGAAAGYSFDVNAIAIYAGTTAYPYVPYGNAGLWARGKNLLSFMAGTSTSNGITFAVSEDGTITASGTSTNLATLHSTLKGRVLPAGTYTLSGCPSGGSDSTYRIELYQVGSSVAVAVDYGSGATFTIGEGMNVDYCRIRIPNGANVSGKVFRPMLRLASTGAEFVPYASTVTPVPLDGHELRSLPDGTRDELTVDERGHAVLVQRVGVAEIGAADWTANSNRYRASIASYGIGTPSGGYDNTRCTAYAPTANTTAQQSADTIRLSADGNYAWLGASSTRVDSTLLYPLATPVTIDLGTIDPVPLCGPDLTAQAIPTAPFALTYERDLNATLARLESAIATLA